MKATRGDLLNDDRFVGNPAIDCFTPAPPLDDDDDDPPEDDPARPPTSEGMNPPPVLEEGKIGEAGPIDLSFSFSLR